MINYQRTPYAIWSEAMLKSKLEHEISGQAQGDIILDPDFFYACEFKLVENGPCVHGFIYNRRTFKVGPEHD